MTNQNSNGAVTTKAETLPAAKIEALEKMAGAGLETVTVDDLPQPRLKILQTTSPEIAGSKDKKPVEGAKAGLIYNNTTDSCSSVAPNSFPMSVDGSTTPLIGCMFAPSSKFKK